MALRKIYIAIDCADDAQKERVQKIAEELSCMRVFDGDMIENTYPILDAKKGQIYNIIQHLKSNGVQGVKSIKFIGLLGDLFV